MIFAVEDPVVSIVIIISWNGQFSFQSRPPHSVKEEGGYFLFGNGMGREQEQTFCTKLAIACFSVPVNPGWRYATFCVTVMRITLIMASLIIGKELQCIFELLFGICESVILKLVRGVTIYW